MIKGSHHSEKTKKKISDALSGEGHPSFGRKFSKERCENISKSLKGEMNPMFGKTGINSPRFGKHLSSEAREKISKSLTGKPLSEEHKMKISEGMRGLGPEISARMSKAQSGEKNVMYGKHHTEETKLKISNSKKGKTLSLEHRAKLSEAHPKLKGKDNPNYGKKRTPEQRREISKRLRGEGNPFFGKKHSPETRKKMSKNHKDNSGERNQNWRGGISFEPYCPKFNDNLRKRVRDFFGNQCLLCGKTKEENGENLSVHHVEYNKNACCDGKKVNFAALCHDCHCKTSGRNRQRWEDMFHVIIDYLYDGRSYYTKEEFENLRERSGENDVSTETNSAWKSEMEVESQNVGVGINSSRAETRRSEVSASV